MVKNPPAMQETWVQSLHGEDPLEKGLAAHVSSLAWRMPWTGESGDYSPWGREESDMTEQLTLSQHFHSASFGFSCVLASPGLSNNRRISSSLEACDVGPWVPSPVSLSGPRQ